MDIIWQDENETFVAAVTKVTMKSGEEFYLCNPFTQVSAERKASESFTADKIVGMKPQMITITSDAVSYIEDVGY